MEKCRMGPNNNELGLIVVGLETLVGDLYALLCDQGVCRKIDVIANCKNWIQTLKSQGMNPHTYQAHEALIARLQLKDPLGEVTPIGGDDG
jgi:hypothetical protein